MIVNQNTLHEPKLLIEIESFTKRIIDDGLKRKDLPELVRLLDAFEQIYSCNYVYADYVGLFEFLASDEFYGFKQIQDGQYTYVSLLEISDGLLDVYSWSFQVNRKKVLSDLRQYKSRVKRRLGKLRMEVEKLFKRYSRNLVVRVDLKYREVNQHMVDIEMFNRHVRKLCNRMANKHTCFKNLKLNAWRLEQAPLGSYHIHLFLIYDGSTSTYDCKLARWVGRVWMKEITEGLGYYWNCHTCKHADEDLEGSDTMVADTESIQKNESYKYLNGLGMIKREDPIGLERLKAVYSYLACITTKKIDQRLRVRVKDMRAFGCSSC
ncbi:YagK/YfjJ domain-containing protein [Acinetobacter sp. ANC 3791]|uniref:YagK/YfjJ domain-containing protein n=1 Tax=Acinetobacter sp. ANC 3791 TaxID=2529836 RepID=UPI00103EC146|nr:inovirus-type Gp2 protein [Acinetobacter sp. ANC 3791]TCB83905.1 inovirus Gp2 family protein [Acinetobacter sp. ANC 3791]